MAVAPKQAQLARLFLHRACIQISTELNSTVPESELQHLTQFLEKHCAQYANEITRALIWRVMASAHGEDRLGAWKLIDHVLNIGLERKAIGAALTDRIAVFLPHLIRARWFGTQRLEAATNQAPRGATSGGYVTVRGENAFKFDEDSVLKAEYTALLRSWVKYFVANISEEISRAAKDVSEGKNQLSDRVHHVLDVPKEYQDSLWKLRRKTPRPSIAQDVWHAYGGANRFPTAESLITACEPMHPRVREWLRKLKDCNGGDAYSDTWKYTVDNSPCSKKHLSQLRLLPKEEALVRLEQNGFRPRVDKLEVLCGAVLDACVKNIINDLPYEEMLSAFDSLRGRLSGAAERRALHIHASYNIYPSFTSLRMNSDSDFSSAYKKAEAHFESLRRHKELKHFRDAVLAIYHAFRVREVSVGHQKAIEDVKAKGSFLFCLLDAQYSFADVKDSPCPEAVEKIAEVLPRVSRGKTLHFLKEGEEEEEPLELWDYYVAGEVLKKYKLIGSRYDEEDRKTAENYLGLLEGSARAQLKIAIKLVLETRVPFCPTLQQYGPRIKHKTARETLTEEGLTLTQLRLRPGILEQRIIEERRKERDSARATKLEDCLKVLGRDNLYPASYAIAIDSLKKSNVPLAACRFVPDAVERFLRTVGMTHLIPHLDTVTRKAFPTVCLFSSSLEQTSEEHFPKESNERKRLSAFLQHLSRNALKLEEYCAAHSTRANKVRRWAEEEFARGSQALEVLGAELVNSQLAEYRREVANIANMSGASQVVPSGSDSSQTRTFNERLSTLTPASAITQQPELGSPFGEGNEVFTSVPTPTGIPSKLSEAAIMNQPSDSPAGEDDMLAGIEHGSGQAKRGREEEEAVDEDLNGLVSGEELPLKAARADPVAAVLADEE